MPGPRYPGCACRTRSWTSESCPRQTRTSTDSPSARWRQHAAADACAVACLQHLELSGARVISGTSALALEQSKVAQHAACVQAGFRCPYIAACPRHMLEQAVRQWTPEEQSSLSSLTAGVRHGRHQGRGGHATRRRGRARRAARGAGVRGKRRRTLTRWSSSRGSCSTRSRCASTRDHTTTAPPTPAWGATARCRETAPSSPSTPSSRPRGRTTAISNAQLAVMRGLDILAVEMIKDTKGRWWVVDCNCVNTNYNSAAEQAAGISGVGAVVDLVVHGRGPLETGE